MGIQVPKGIGPLSNSECCGIVDLRGRGIGVSLMSERGTTQPLVKAPKYQLSVKGQRVSMVEDSEAVGLEAATR